MIPYSLYEELELGELRPTRITLQLADRSIRHPRGIIEDVLVKVDRFVFPADFIILDMAMTPSPKNQIPIILGRPFLATADANISCRTGVMKMRFGDMKISLNIFYASKAPSLDYEESECEEVCGIDLIDELVEEALPSILSPNSLEPCLAYLIANDFDVNAPMEEMESFLDAFSCIADAKWSLPFEPLPPLAKEVPKQSLEEPPILELKPLPNTLNICIPWATRDSPGNHCLHP